MTPTHLLCEYCGEEYSVKPSHAEESRFCSRECLYAWRSENHSGQGSPLSKEKVALECEWCGEERLVKPSIADRSRFCSYECMGKWRSATQTGENNPVWKDDVEVECKQCGDAYSVVPARAEKTSFYSPQCRWDWLSENKSGQDSPHWRPGAGLREELRLLLPGPSWRRIREKHLGTECALCGVEDQLHLHHIIPILAGGTHHPDNLLTLCISCHNCAEAFVRPYVEYILVPDG